MVSFFVAASLATAAPVSLPATTPVQHASPAMFAVRDADTTIYLFGTFHALDGQGQWFTDQVRTAFEQSDSLVLETLLPDQPMGPARFGRAVRPPSVTPGGSFLATTRMAVNAGRAQGMQVSHGADMVLRRTAEAEGKPVEALETLQFQINMFNRLPPARAVAAPRAGQPVAASPMANLSQAMVEMQAAWKRGDQAVFVRMLDQLRNASPDTYRMMFTERNGRWADWIRARMQAPGTVFVAVGAGHLVGKDSLLVRLAEHGISSQRVN